MTSLAQVSQEASYAYTGRVSLTGGVLVMGLTAYGRSPSEAHQLNTFMQYVIPLTVQLLSHHLIDGLEARVTEGTQELDMNEPESSEFKIEVRPLSGSIETVARAQRYGADPTSTGFVSADHESVTIDVQREVYFRGRHLVTIFYQPRHSGSQ